MQTPRSWRVAPFVVGHTYRVRHDFQALRDTFTAGDLLIYDHDTYSHYHAYTGYVFSQPDSDRMRVWDIHDDEDIDRWHGFFEAMQ